jgi:hypothetical protein
MRWWWPGGNVNNKEIATQISTIHRSGFGGVEIHIVNLGLESEKDARVLSFGDSWLTECVREACAHAHGIGMKVTVNAGSGWPIGGCLPKEMREIEVRLSVIPRVEGPFDGVIPYPPEALYRNVISEELDIFYESDPGTIFAVVAVCLSSGNRAVDVSEFLDRTSRRLTWTSPSGTWAIVGLYMCSTERRPIGSAIRGRSYVADHLNPESIRAVLGALPYRGCGADEALVDSFELVNQLAFTPSFLTSFKAEYGYDLAPHIPSITYAFGETKYGDMKRELFRRVASRPLEYLPLLRHLSITDINPFHPCLRSNGPMFPTEEGARAREDYQAHRGRLFLKAIQQVRRSLRSQGLTVRMQGYGGFSHPLDVYKYADVPEVESLFCGGDVPFLSLASSAAHVYGKRRASCELFITISIRNGCCLSFEEKLRMVGRAFSAGVNHVTFHGMPYPYTREDGTTWYPFLPNAQTGPFTLTCDFSGDVKLLTTYVSRLSFLMQKGTPVTDLAWVCPDRVFRDEVVFREQKACLRRFPVFSSLCSLGHTYTAVSPAMVGNSRCTPGIAEVGECAFSLVIVDIEQDHAPFHFAQGVQRMLDAGVTVVVFGAQILRASGLYRGNDNFVRGVFGRTRVASDEAALLDTLATVGQHAGVRCVPREHIGFRVRELDGDLIVYAFNDSDGDDIFRFRPLSRYRHGRVHDPMSGRIRHLQGDGHGGYRLQLAALSAVVVVLSR